MQEKKLAVLQDALDEGIAELDAEPDAELDADSASRRRPMT
jgi:hypothetical protein